MSRVWTVGGVERRWRLFLLEETVYRDDALRAFEPFFGLDYDDWQVHEHKAEHTAANPQHVDCVGNVATQRGSYVDERCAYPSALVEAGEAGGQGGQRRSELRVSHADGGNDGVDCCVHGCDVGQHKRVRGAEKR